MLRYRSDSWKTCKRNTPQHEYKQWISPPLLAVPFFISKPMHFFNERNLTKQNTYQNQTNK